MLIRGIYAVKLIKTAFSLLLLNKQKKSKTKFFQLKKNLKFKNFVIKN